MDEGEGTLPLGLVMAVESWQTVHCFAPVLIAVVGVQFPVPWQLMQAWSLTRSVIGAAG